MIDKATEGGIEKLFNYGVLGIVVILLIAAIWFIVKHYLKRQTYWEQKLETKSKDQLELTLKFTDLVNDFKQTQKDHNTILDKLQKDGVSHTEVLRDLKNLIHNHS